MKSPTRLKTGHAPRSKYWADDALVIQNRRITRPDPLPTFGNSSRWDLRALGWNPAAGRHSMALNFDGLDNEWNLRARELSMALLNPIHDVLRNRGVYLRAAPLSVKTVQQRLVGLKSFADWHATNHANRPPRDLRQADLDEFLAYAKPAWATTRLCATIEMLRALHTFDAVLTGGGLSFTPWANQTASALAGRRTNSELSTPVIPPAVWWPLLHACWRYIDVFSHDIFAAAEEWAVLDRPVDDRKRVQHVDASIDAWLSDSENAVPAHRLTHGVVQRGEIHWSLLSLLITSGHSQSLFAGPQKSYSRARRDKIRRAVATGKARLVLGGLKTQAAHVTRTDGSSGPWIEGFDPATIREQLKILRNACYAFCAALTMMRDSELLSIKKDSLTTFHGAPAVKSQLRKGRRGTHLRNWWIIEPVAQAIAVAERLAHGDEVFASIRKSQSDDNHLMHFDRHDELRKLVRQLNSIAPTAGFEQIPEFRLAPHMFRRTMAVITAQQPDGEIALGIQLKHAARRAVANGTTSGYASETPEWAAEFEHELQDAVAARLVGFWASRPTAEVRFAGAGAQRFRDGLAAIEEDAPLSVKIGDERTLRSLLRDRFSTLRWGTINHCLGIPEQAACLTDVPPEAAKNGVIPNRCQPSTCRNSVVTEEHAPIWIAEERDLFSKLKDRRLAPHHREQLETELSSVQKITKRFADG